MADRDMHVDYMRIRGFPFSRQVEEFLLEHDTVFVIEQNRDGQLRNMLLLETSATKDRLKSVRHYGGIPLCAEDVIKDVLQERIATAESRSIEA
jgi:2-oxoglutarate ferredoxin oxidoreductase subunit alpha